MSNLIASKELEFLINKAGLTAPQFAADYAKATGVRRAVAEEWLANRKIRPKNLEKLASYWRRFFPQIDATHFVMPQEAFERAFGAQAVRQPSAPPASLPFQTNPLSQTQIGALTACFRLYWYSLPNNKPAVQWESLIISADPKSDGGLTAELRTPLARGVQTFAGAVIVWGERMYMVLADVDPSSSAMRFITLHGRFEKKNRNVLGIMSGAFDKNDTLASRTVALEKQAAANQNDREEASLREPVNLDRFPAEILLELTQNKLSGTS